MPTDPGPSRWALPDPAHVPAAEEVVAVGADLAPATLLAGYRAGLFPMPMRGRLLWFSPDPRGVLPLDGFRASRSLRRSARRFELSVDQSFEPVLQGCAAPGRPGGRWITRGYARAYRELHALGWAHSVEVWCDGQLAGGLLGVQIGGLFCGETMFHRISDGSKVAVWGTVALLTRGGGDGRMFDVQWVTPHLASLGAVDVPRSRYLEALPPALSLPPALGPTGRVPAARVLLAAG